MVRPAALTTSSFGKKGHLMATSKSIRRSPSFQDLSGQRFGKLIAVRCVSTIGEKPRWLCRCDCGGENTILADSLRSGRTKSCGCIRGFAIVGNRTHGLSATAEHGIWRRMIGRCHCPTSDHYDRYGGRGIAVCDRWRESFENFLADMGKRPSPQHSIGRKDNDGPYCPDNCEWETQTQQTRNLSRNRHLTHDGETLLLVDWAQRTGFSKSIITHRIDRLGWSVDDALTISPVHGRNHH